MIIEKIDDGIKTYLLTNDNNMQVEITTFGARIKSIKVPDKNGVLTEVTCGFENAEEYKTTENPYFGATVGRYANRIKNGEFTLNGKKYVLPKNDNENCLHGGIKGFDKRNFESVINENGLLLSYYSKDGEEGFPGNLSLSVNFSLGDDNALSIEYFAICDQDTYINLTNHTYFNLSGDFSKPITSEVLRIKSDYITACDEKLIQTGELVPVKNTPLDFNSFKEIGEDIEKENVFLKNGGGYDFNYVLKNDGDYVAKAFDPVSLIEMSVYTDMPCMQFYSGNFLDGLKGRSIYNKRTAFCLETQNYPDSMNNPSFPQAILKANEEFTSKTVYKFSVFEK